MKLVFWTNGSFAVPIIEEHSESIDLIVTGTDKRTGRGLKISESPVKRIAREKKIELIQTDNIKDDSFIERLKEGKFEIFFVCNFGKILPDRIIEIPDTGIFNIHPPLLPDYKGPAPIHWVLLKGEKVTGVTIHRITKEIDSGSILLQKRLEISENDNFITLFDKLSKLSVKLTGEFLSGMNEGSVFEPIETNETENLIYARKLKKEEFIIDWNRPSDEIRNLIRALYKKPSAEFFHKNRMFKVLKTEILDERVDAKPGTILSFDRKDLFKVKTKDGALRILRIKPENRNEMDIKDFINGYNLKEGTIL